MDRSSSVTASRQREAVAREKVLLPSPPDGIKGAVDLKWNCILLSVMPAFRVSLHVDTKA